MITPPFSAPQGYISALHPKEDKQNLWFVYSRDQLLISEEGTIPSHPCVELKRHLYIGTFDNHHVFAGESNIDTPSQGYVWKSLRTLYGILHEDHFAIAGHAKQLLDWDRTHKYCGCCGKETFTREHERCRECSNCKHLAYPKLAPAVMVLVKKEEEILLARGPHFPDSWYSVIAGFVDPGETLEQCVVREVFEEVGIKVKNICYFGSQPWPFPSSLMIAFTCEWESGEICIDPNEITLAAWFESTNLPPLPPLFSLARILIEAHIPVLRV